MMTQHPDCATKYIPIQAEPEEAIYGLTPQPEGLGIEEVMIDFEGKLTPYHQTVQIALGLLEKGVVPGRDVFITPRIASAIQESPFRQLMALMSLMEANVTAFKRSDFPAVKEVIIPMSESPDELAESKRRVVDVIDLANKEFGLSADPHLVELIPLVEEVPELLSIHLIVGGYLDKLEEMGWELNVMRVMIGRSDPALSYGLVAAVLSSKIALSRLFELGEEREVKIQPILGAGSLPFRGHVTLENISNLLEEFAGVRTLTIQSALRYDHGFEKTKKLVSLLKEKLAGEGKGLSYSKDEYEFLGNCIGLFAVEYLKTFPRIIDPVVRVADLMPKQRDRLARYTSVGYARDVAKPQKLVQWISHKKLREELAFLSGNLEPTPLPRAISFTGALYTLGFPPEFLGTGRGLKKLKEIMGEKGVSDLLSLYPGLKNDLAFAAKFLHPEVAKDFFSEKALGEMREDIEYVEEILGIKIGPRDEESRFYSALLETTKPILRQLTNGLPGIPRREEAESIVRDWIVRQGKIRGSLG
jgi:phosphoenolpyruvate carboxylase